MLVEEAKPITGNLIKDFQNMGNPLQSRPYGTKEMDPKSKFLKLTHKDRAKRNPMDKFTIKTLSVFTYQAAFATVHQ